MASNLPSIPPPEPLSPADVVDVASGLGPLYLHASDEVMTPFIREHGEWEAGEAAFLREALTAGMTFVDIGANVGYFSLLGSKLVGPRGSVVAIEPEPRNVRLLRANLWRHGCANAVVLPVAAARERGFVPFRVDEGNRGNHQIGSPAQADLWVAATSLDDLLGEDRVDVVKIDTQGVDHEVIAGMSGLISKYRGMTILTEFWIDGMRAHAADPLEVARGYRGLGFELLMMEGDGPALRPVEPEALVAAAGAHEDGYRNVVLRRRT